jgi:hypothetical protein
MYGTSATFYNPAKISAHSYCDANHSSPAAHRCANHCVTAASTYNGAATAADSSQGTSSYHRYKDTTKYPPRQQRWACTNYTPPHPLYSPNGDCCSRPPSWVVQTPTTNDTTYMVRTQHDRTRRRPRFCTKDPDGNPPTTADTATCDHPPTTFVPINLPTTPRQHLLTSPPPRDADRG